MTSGIGGWGIAPFALIAACAHGTSYERPAAQAPVLDCVTAIRRCIDAEEACGDFTTLVQATLRQRLGVAAAGRLVDALVGTLRRADESPALGEVITHCRRGHQMSCRALWWAMDRLYLDEEATPSRANECPLTRALAAAVEL